MILIHANRLMCCLPLFAFLWSVPTCASIGIIFSVPVRWFPHLVLTLACCSAGIFIAYRSTITLCIICTLGAIIAFFFATVKDHGDANYCDHEEQLGQVPKHCPTPNQTRRMCTLQQCKA